jgi:predicted nucleic acid-binding protein
LSEIVIDASAALAFVLPSQATGAAMEFLASHDMDAFVAPYVFTWEVGNVLVRHRQRGLLSPDAYRQAFTDLAELDIALGAPPSSDEVEALGELAIGEDLRLFDAAYLALAIERGGALASRDERLLEVARRCVPSFDLTGESIS